MVWLLRKCEHCSGYTLSQEKCPRCGGKVRIPHPAKFSPQDKYAKYRRAMRVEMTKQGLDNEGNLC
ncbi:MAG TPA: RNA-protein complex protein Nop10 [Candidatus Bathyarchaeia archaeon]|nr:RNA-protein complex protein Nop10 [Candidatus Bathyarchaeia archaeon]